MVMLKALTIGGLFTVEELRAHSYHDYTNKGEDWADTVENAQMCRSGREQSPIDLSTEVFNVSDKMQINGYGY